MKFFTITLATVAFMKFSFAQTNLISNYSFEEYSQCPEEENDVPYAIGWENWLATPDYFNACSTDGFATVPYSLGNGIQYARTGNAYTGLFTYWPHFYWNPYPWEHEFIGAHLQQPLQVGETYYFEMYVSLGSWIYSPCSSNHIGVKFTTQTFSSYGNTFVGSPLMNNSAHIYVDSMITDTANWVKVSGNVIADSAYQYLVIGNFFDDDHTDTSIIGAAPFCYSYYFVDDVCLSTDSSGCLVTDVQELNAEGELSISPNPFGEQCSIKIVGWNSNDIRLKLTDEFGRLREVNYNSYLQSKRTTLTIYKGNLEKGMYFLSITAAGKQAVIPLIIQ